jgi:hypothetical protein
MSDSKDIRGPQDRSRVALDQDYEVRYWTQRFECSEEELRRAVRKVGNSVEAIVKELKR